MRAGTAGGGDRMLGGLVGGLALSLQIPFWVAVVLAGVLQPWESAAQIAAVALQNAFDQSGGRGGCIDATWLLALFGIPAVTAVSNGC